MGPVRNLGWSWESLRVPPKFCALPLYRVYRDQRDFLVTAKKFRGTEPQNFAHPGKWASLMNYDSVSTMEIQYEILYIFPTVHCLELGVVSTIRDSVQYLDLELRVF